MLPQRRAGPRATAGLEGARPIFPDRPEREPRQPELSAGQNINKLSSQTGSVFLAGHPDGGVLEEEQI